MSIEIISSEIQPLSEEEQFAAFEIMRKAYASTEIEIWGENYIRMPLVEYKKLIVDGNVTIAKWEGVICGCIYSKQLDQHTFTFGLLGTHENYKHKGIGRKLIESVENRARVKGAQYMNIEILRPRDFTPPVKDILKAWYHGMDYHFSHSQNFEDRRPDRAPYLKVPSVFDCYQKNLE